MDTWVVGNWKMNGTLTQLGAFVPALLSGLPQHWEQRARVAVCPPHPYLGLMREQLSGSNVELGAQRSHPLAAGPFTGDVSPAMLREFGVTVCIVGHSEQRQYTGVTDALVSDTVHGLLAADIVPLVCVGESLRERKAGAQEAVVRDQLLAAFRESQPEHAQRRGVDAPVLEHAALSPEQARGLIVAYEPVWAIGTGVTATPQQANEMHAFMRGLLRERFGAESAGAIPLLYGGSVNPANAAELMAQREINGALVGGASLKPEDFVSIIKHSIN